jgi:hypothetical protein
MSNAQMEQLLVVTDDPGAEQDLRPRLEELAGTRHLEIKILAPGRPGSGLDLFTGEADRLLAIEDALATFDADRIVLVALDEDLLSEAQKRFDLPVSQLAPA